MSVIMEICQKILTPCAPSFKVTVINMDRSATSNFLLVICSNHEHISYHFLDNKRYLQNSPTPVYLTPPLTGVPLECHNGTVAQKLE